MRKLSHVLTLVFVLLFGICLIGCGKNKIVADYGNAEVFEAALNKGENTEGKIVSFVADEIHPDSAFGYDIWAGEHLNFSSSKNPGIKEGETVAVKVTSVENILGSWMITYEIVNNVIVDDSKASAHDGENVNVAEAPIVVERTDDTSEQLENAYATEEVTPKELTLEYVDMDIAGFRDYAGSPTISAYVAIRNNNDVPITFSNLSLDFEDNDGNLLGTDSFAQCIPEAIMPGQIGYIYSYYYDLTGIDINNGFALQPNGDVIVADNFYEIEVSDVSFKAGSGLDISVIGRGTNNTGKEQLFAEPAAVFFDSDDKVVGFCYGLDDYQVGQTKTFEISGDMMSEDMSPSLVDHVEVYIQGNGW